MAFNIPWNFEMLMEHEDYSTSDFHYKVRAFILSTDGAEVASWTASAWSKERKFFCSAKVCGQQCNQDHEPRGMERGMLPHNTRDRAIKRAFVALIRNATGTTGYFKQALDNPSSNGGAEPGGLPPSWPCPECGGTMQLKEGKYGPYYSHKKGKDWHNLDAKIVSAEIAAAEPPETVEDDIPVNAGIASGPEQVPNDQQPPETPSMGDSEQEAPEFKNLGELLEKAWVQHGQTRSGVAFLAKFESAEAMTEAFKNGEVSLEALWSTVVDHKPMA
jgi:hypothetical protein